MHSKLITWAESFNDLCYAHSMFKQDHSYKLLFSHTAMVEDLLRGFIHEEWVKELDFTTLEKVSGSFISDDLRERENDLIWRDNSFIVPNKC